MLHIFLVFVCVSFVSVSCQEDPIVTIAQGDVQGVVRTTVSGRPYYSFRGIPYGQPPLGELRFQPPLPAGGWDGIWDATIDASACIQDGFGSEDCLYLNVYTPKLPDGGVTLPTMIFVHGGAFFTGSPSSLYYGPQLLLEKDVIYVSIAYRLGAFGFLSTGDRAASGNYGLLDQSLAFKWVHDNIAAFGGDANRVIIFGESAGAASVSYHMLSPASAGLFLGVIQESGSALTDWSVQIDPLPVATLLAEEFACPTNNTQLMIDCIRGQPAEDIVEKSKNIGGYNVLATPFMPVIEDPEFGLFITQPAIDILQSGNYNKVPNIAGCNKDEGDLPYAYLEDYYANIGEPNFFNETLPAILYIVMNYRTNLVNISYAIKAEYYDKIDITNSTQVARASIDWMSDAGYKAPNDRWIRAISENMPAYMYIFGYVGVSSANNYSGEPEVSHGEELFYIFSQGYNLEGDDITVSNAFIDMWTNFAINLDPNPLPGDAVWDSSPAGGIQYLQFNLEQTMIDGYRTEQMDFWNRVVPAIAAG